MALTRRELVSGMAGLVAGQAGAVGRVAEGMTSSAAAAAPAPRATEDGMDAAPRLRVATCQFPVSADILQNSEHIQHFVQQAARQGANLLHTSEASLSGYPGVDRPSFNGFQWDVLRKQTYGLMSAAKQYNIWLVLGSAHFLDESTRPTNCLYLISPEGVIENRYDKCFCTGFEKSADDPFYVTTKAGKSGRPHVYPAGDLAHYSPGDRLVTQDINGVRIGLAICYDICWPQIYIAYRERGATVILHSFHNARYEKPNCLETLNVRQVPTRCADNRLWAVCNNSSQPYSEWGSFIARPDATIPKELPINEPGMLIHDFPDGLSDGGWYHNYRPMNKREDEIMHSGTVSHHPRQLDGKSPV